MIDYLQEQLTLHSYFTLPEEIDLSVSLLVVIEIMIKRIKSVMKIRIIIVKS